MFDSHREEQTRITCSEVLADVARLRASMGRIRLTVPREMAFSQTLSDIEAVYRDLDDHARHNLSPRQKSRRRRPHA